MTKQEYQTVKTIIYACSTITHCNGTKSMFADTVRIIAALDNIFASDLGIPREEVPRDIKGSAEHTSTEDNVDSSYNWFFSLLDKLCIHKGEKN